MTRLIDGLRRDRRQHPHRGRSEYSERARQVAGAIADMIESGGAADAVPLARRAVERVTAAMPHMDDSSGIIGDDLRMLTALYARACRAAPPDPKQLAAWLVTPRLDGPGWPDIELAHFADALFVAVVEAHMLDGFGELGLSPAELRRSVTRIRRELGDEYALATRRVATDEVSLLIDMAESFESPSWERARDGQQVMRTTSGSPSRRKRPCYPCVGRLPDPDLCCLCVACPGHESAWQVGEVVIRPWLRRG